ncbi:MAG: CRTAC1 family protein, partial [Planctomycetes bacterium]|nr:CRTAC1 family protein [Planctomycetota bacterium]
VPIAPGRLPAAVRPDGTTAQPTFVLADLTGDGALEVVLPVGGEGQGAAAVFSEDPPGAWREVQRLPVDAAACAAGDIDGDFDADLVLAGSGWLRFFENDGTGRLAEKALQVRGAAHGGFPVRLVCADLDSDWDLDVACLRQEAGEGGKVRSRIEVLNNNLNGTFLDISAECGTASLDLAAAELVAADLDGDIDADLLVIDGRSGAAVVFANDRMWRYRRVEVAARAPGVASAAGGDLDGDGDEDLVLFCGEALRLWRNDGGLRFEEDEAFAERFGALGGSAGVVADLQGALRPSALVLDARSEGRGPAHIPALDAPAALPLSLEGLSGPGGRSAAFTVTSPGKPPALIVCDAATGAAMYPVASPAAGWLVLDLAGPKKPVSKLERANAAGVGASVEVRAGLRGAVFRLHGGAGGGGRPSARVACGLGGAASADYVRILWPDGILQAERGLAPGKLHRIQEVERKPTSCPILFAWTQGGWELVADFLGVGGLGYLEAKDSYSRPDPTEYVLLPPLEPLEGRYRLDVLEPLEECTYLDELKLTVVDHPEDVTVLPEEMFAVRGPAPGFRLLAFRGKLHPESARDQSGQLVTGELREADRLYGNRVSPDPRFPGLARESHWIELDFGAGIADLLAKGGPSARPYLFLHGYVEYGYSTSNFAAWQAGETFRAPTVLAERGDAWVPLREEWGFPAGYPRTMTVDLAGVLEPGDRKLRVATNMVIHWDQAFLADAGSGGGVKTQDLDADAASLSFRGYPPEESPDGSHPALYAYRDLESEAPFKVFPGAYTRYGDVRELLGAADDRFAILGPGDGLEVEVRADRLPPVAPGMRRTFLARTVGYCKDMDPYTAHPERVEPLPFRAMSGYPYGPAEAHPATPEHETYRRRWNTRVVE